MSRNLDDESLENTTVTLGVPSAVSDNSRATRRIPANDLGIYYPTSGGPVAGCAAIADRLPDADRPTVPPDLPGRRVKVQARARAAVAAI